jgi:predicted RNase H-like HicB family nuclease
MIINYIQAALRKAHYEFVADGKRYFGSVPGLKGVWADGATLEECRETLAQVIEDWVWAHVRDGKPVPKIDGITVAPNPATVPELA